MTPDQGTEGGWDIHTHLMPQPLIAAAAQGDFGMKLEPDAIDVHGFRLALKTMGNPKALLDRIDDDGLHGAAVGVPPPLFRADLPTSERAAYIDLLNNGLLETVDVAPERLRPLAYLPTDIPQLAVSVADALDDRWAGVIVGTDLGAHSYADESYHDLWRILSDRKLPVLLHPSESKDARLKPFYLSNLIGNPMETTIAAANLVFGDVLGQFPDLQFVLSHGGGAVGMLYGRWQRGMDTDRPGIRRLTLPPVEAVRRFNVDNVVHSPAQLSALVDILGSERILLGSDWPFPMGSVSASASLHGIDAEIARLIRHDNPRRIFGFAWAQET